MSDGLGHVHFMNRDTISHHDRGLGREPSRFRQIIEFARTFFSRFIQRVNEVLPFLPSFDDKLQRKHIWGHIAR